MCINLCLKRRRKTSRRNLLHINMSQALSMKVHLMLYLSSKIDLIKPYYIYTYVHTTQTGWHTHNITPDQSSVTNFVCNSIHTNLYTRDSNPRLFESKLGFHLYNKVFEVIMTRPLGYDWSLILQREQTYLPTSSDNDVITQSFI